MEDPLELVRYKVDGQREPIAAIRLARYGGIRPFFGQSDHSENDETRRASGGGACPAGNASTSSGAYRTLLPLRPPKNRRNWAAIGRSRSDGWRWRSRNDASSP